MRRKPSHGVLPQDRAAEQAGQAASNAMALCARTRARLGD